MYRVSTPVWAGSLPMFHSITHPHTHMKTQEEIERRKVLSLSLSTQLGHKIQFYLHHTLRIMSRDISTYVGTQEPVVCIHFFALI